MSDIKNEKFIIKVIRKRITEIPAHQDSASKIPKIEEKVDQIYEQEFDNLDIGELAMKLNRKEKKDGQEKDEKSIKI